MIFFWIVSALRWIAWLFRPPTPQQIARINPRMNCPVCGAMTRRRSFVEYFRNTRPYSLRTILQVDHAVEKGQPIRGRIMCQHRCPECGARWFEKPILTLANPSTVLPAVPRDEVEKSEDRAATMARMEETKS